MSDVNARQCDAYLTDYKNHAVNENFYHQIFLNLFFSMTPVVIPGIIKVLSSMLWLMLIFVFH